MLRVWMVVRTATVVVIVAMIAIVMVATALLHPISLCRKWVQMMLTVTARVIAVTMGELILQLMVK